MASQPTDADDRRLREIILSLKAVASPAASGQRVGAAPGGSKKIVPEFPAPMPPVGDVQFDRWMQSPRETAGLTLAVYGCVSRYSPSPCPGVLTPILAGDPAGSLLAAGMRSMGRRRVAWPRPG